jgi:hypothetical protein
MTYTGNVARAAVVECMQTSGLKKLSDVTTVGLIFKWTWIQLASGGEQRWNLALHEEPALLVWNVFICRATVSFSRRMLAP